jgi:hypothetical protein
MAYKTIIVDGVEIPVLPAEVETTIKNKITGQVYTDMAAFSADVADPNTDTKEEHLQQDTVIKVASLVAESQTQDNQ